MKTIILTVITTLLFTSCGTEQEESKSTSENKELNEDSFPKGYWIDSDRTSIIMFSSNGDITNIVANVKVSDTAYEFIENTPKYFSIDAKREGTFHFHEASEDEFFLGEWKATLNNEKSNLKFFYSDFTYILLSFDGIETETLISSNDNSISIKYIDFEYRFSEAKDSIYLSNMDYNLILTRGAWSDEEVSEADKGIYDRLYDMDAEMPDFEDDSTDLYLDDEEFDADAML